MFIVGQNRFVPNRLTSFQFKNEKVKKILSAILLVLIISCAPKVFKAEWAEEIAPGTFVVRFETSKGNFDVETIRNLSPKAADRFYQLVKHRYFDNGIFYRVNPGFVAQFGSSDTVAGKNWSAIKIPDEKVVQGNFRGTLSFGRGGKETRSTDLYINLGDNSRLDTLLYNGVRGFPSFGKVISGMNVVDSLYSGYADTTMDTLDLMYSNRVEFSRHFPKLDLIKKVYLIKKE